MAHPDFSTGFEVQYSTADHRYHATLHGIEVGAGWTYIEAEAAAQAPYQALTDAAGDPEEQDGPSEEGGEGGPSEPPDIYGVAYLAAHVAREVAALEAAPCDVCGQPGGVVWFGRWPAYPAHLCPAHKAVA